MGGEKTNIMKPFTFLRNYLVESFTENHIYPGDTFYIMTKQELKSVSIWDMRLYFGGRGIPKYTIITKDVLVGTFKPNYDLYYYFKSKEMAEYMRTVLECSDHL